MSEEDRAKSKEVPIKQTLYNFTSTIDALNNMSDNICEVADTIQIFHKHEQNNSKKNDCV